MEQAVLHKQDPFFLQDKMLKTCIIYIFLAQSKMFNSLLMGTQKSGTENRIFRVVQQNGVFFLFSMRAAKKKITLNIFRASRSDFKCSRFISSAKKRDAVYLVVQPGERLY